MSKTKLLKFYFSHCNAFDVLCHLLALRFAINFPTGVRKFARTFFWQLSKRKSFSVSKLYTLQYYFKRGRFAQFPLIFTNECMYKKLISIQYNKFNFCLIHFHKSITISLYTFSQFHIVWVFCTSALGLFFFLLFDVHKKSFSNTNKEKASKQKICCLA